MEGIGDNFISYTFAQTKRAKIKDFTLIWPAGDESRRARVVQLLNDSFTSIERIVDPTRVILPSKRLICSQALKYANRCVLDRAFSSTLRGPCLPMPQTSRNAGVFH